MRLQGSGERREVGDHNVADNFRFYPEVSMYQDIAEATDLRPADFRVCISYVLWKVIRSLADYLQVPFDGVLSHEDEVVSVVVQPSDVLLASIDSVRNVVDTPN